MCFKIKFYKEFIVALISKKIEEKKEKIKIELSSSVIEEIKNYMEWADLSDINYFAEESFNHIFNSDREWKKHKKNINKKHSKTETQNAE